MKRKLIKIKDLYDNFDLYKDKVYVRDLSNNLTPILDVITKKSECVEVEFDNNLTRKVANTHRFMDVNDNEVFAKDATEIRTKTGSLSITKKTNIGEQQVYDISINEPHWYYDQYDIIHHNCGKSLGLVHLASSYIKQGYNVMYFTLEMSEKAIAKRIHGNLLNTSINSFAELGKERFDSRIERLKSKSYGKLKIKEFGTGSASVLHFKNTLNDLKTKKNFTPDIILVDYLGIMASSKIKISSGANTNTYQKYVAEELRDLAFEYNAACFTGMQLNRGGMSDTDFDMTDVADSIAVTTVADFMLGIVRTEELDSMGQVLMKQLKNRYGSKTTNIRFVSGVDLEKQQWFDVNETEQDNIIQEQAMFNTKPTNLKNKFSSMDN